MVRERKSAEVLDSARRLFLRRGYAATSVSDIAADAAVSKATIYNNFPDKDALLTALVERSSAEAAAILLATTAPLERPGPVAERLLAVAEALVAGVLRPEVVQLRRLAIAESAGHPEIGRVYWERGPGATLDLLRTAFRRLREDGELQLADPAGAAERFAYALLGPLQDRALLAPAQAFTSRQLDAHVRAAVRALLAEGGGAA